MVRKKVALFIILAFAAVMFVSGCFADKSVADRRAEKASLAAGDINIGVVWPISASEDNFCKGVKLARDEINRSGGVLGRKINLIIKDTEGSALKELRIIHELSENPDILAVAGHFNSPSSVHAAAIYQKSGLLAMFTGVTDYRLTEKNHNLIFRNAGDDRHIGSRLAGYAAFKKYRKIVMLYAYTDQGRNMATAFENRCDDYEINIVERRGYFKDSDKSFDNIIASWQCLEFDAICLIGELPQIGSFIVRLKDSMINKPLIAAGNISGPELKSCAGNSAEGLALITPFHICDNNKIALEFARNIKKEYGVENIDQFCALGYDGLKFLAHAINEAKSAVPAVVAKKIHSGLSAPGVSGLQKFDEKGDIIDKEYEIVTYKNGIFEFEKH